MISVVQTETFLLIGWQKNSTAWKSRLRYMVRSESKLPWIRHFTYNRSVGFQRERENVTMFSGNKIVPNCMVQSTFVVVTLF